MIRDVDVVIVGAGPAGLCMANALLKMGLRVNVLEKLGLETIANPAFDGREIALTHASVKFLKSLAVWPLIAPSEVSSLRDVKVLNGPSLLSFSVKSEQIQQAELGYLVPNHLIRQAAYEAYINLPNAAMSTNVSVLNIHNHADHITLDLSNGQTLNAKLLIAADSRYSETRRAMGISADMHDFGKSMLVCVMAHEIHHQHTAWEWFDYGQTLALLPMNGQQSSVVFTQSRAQVDGLMQLSEEAFNLEMAARFQQRLGSMRLVSSRHAYPLVTVYAKRFIADNFALVGDAAVGMHPVTAHGFNFGLKSVETLSAAIQSALLKGQAVNNTQLLKRYERKHRQHTLPLFAATHAIAKLYSDDRKLAKLLRGGVLKLASKVRPMSSVVAGFLA